MAGLPRRVQPVSDTLLILALGIMLLAPTLWGCAHRDMPPQGAGAAVLEPSVREYSKDGVTLRLHPLRPEESTGVELFDGLLKRGFIVIRLTVINGSDKTALYNAANTFLFVPPMDYKKPLDLSDLYFMLRNSGGDALATTGVESLGRRLMSSSVRIAPHSRTEGYLIFRPLSEPPQGSPLTIGINQLYLGTGAVDIRFTFRAR